MRVRISFITLFFVFACSVDTLFAQNYGSGNVILVRVGTGLDALSNTGSPVFLDEYTPTGTIVSQTTIPTTANGSQQILIVGGTSTTEGMITRSLDGHYLVLAGYNRPLGGVGSLSSTTSASVARSIARIDASKNIDLTTALTDFASAGSPRSAVTSDGTKFWGAGGTNGIRYFTLGSTTSTQISTTITNARVVGVADNRLFVSSATTTYRLGQMGTGLPETAGQTLVNLPGYPTASGSAYQFIFFDLNASEPGPDVLYVADDTQGILKYSLVAGTWVANGTTGVAADAYRGLTGYKNAVDNSIVLFATRKGGTGGTGGGELVTLTDNTGYNVSIGTPTITLLATAATNQAYRGVAMAPEAISLPVDVLSFTASKTSRAHVLAWTTAQENNISRYVVERSQNGQQFTALQALAAKGNQLYNAYQIDDVRPLAGNNFYRLRIEEKDGTVRYSKLVRLQAANNTAGFAVWPNPVQRGAGITVQHPVAKTKATISIYTLEGKMLLQYPVPAEAMQTSLNSQLLVAGLYRLVYNNGTQQTATQISVQ